MPTTLAFTPQPAALSRAIVPFIDTSLNLYSEESANKVRDFTKTVFGADATAKALADRKEERHGMAMNGDVDESGACMSLMRGYKQLKDVLAEPANAAEVKTMAEEIFGVEKVKEEWEKIEGGN